MMKLVIKAAAGFAIAALACSTASAQAVQVKVSDLNLSDPSQVQTLNNRLDAAAYKLCASSNTDLSRRAACVAGVRAEAQDKLGYQVAKQNSKMKVASR
jgi:UrcA family protein